MLGNAVRRAPTTAAFYFDLFEMQRGMAWIGLKQLELPVR